MKRYLRLLFLFTKNSLIREMEFKTSFFLDTFAYLGWGGLNVAFFGFIYGHVEEVAGWDLNSVYLLTATYLLVKTILQTLFQANLKHLNNLVVDGYLDLVLAKPLSAQFYVSLRRIRLQGMIRVFFVLGLIYFLLKRSSMTVSLFTIYLYTIFIILAVLFFYSLWFMGVTLVFWLGRINNIDQISKPLLNLTKLPVGAYPPKVSFLLTFVLPLVLITTIPTETLLGNFHFLRLILGTLAAVIFLYLSHRVWQLALKRYSSAGG